MSSKKRPVPPLPSSDNDTLPPLPKGNSHVPTSATVSSLVEVFRCVICMDKLRDARLCPHCSKMFCLPCIRIWLTKHRSQCPHCRESLDVHELVNCRWAEEVTQQLDTQQQTAPHTREENSSSEWTEECREHQERLSVYCQTCEQNICYQCALCDGPHSGHTFKPLDGVYELQKKKLADELSQLRSRHHELISRAEDVSQPSHPLSRYVWFHEDADQQIAKERVMKVDKEGAFLVRPSNQSSCYALVFIKSNKIHKVQISQRSDERYATGAEKPGEKRFGSVSALIEHYQNKKDFILSHPVPRP